VSIIYVLIPLAIILVAVALGIFFWAVKSDQFQDLERQGYSILFDDDLPEEERHQQAKTQDKANNDNE
jgi:cbb3-type cytochrome oxidase maturation protein|tara:strand:- start:3295 stop:3498 length:204 start_codon:yes stop_codon:yes gene_type:complete